MNNEYSFSIKYVKTFLVSLVVFFSFIYSVTAQTTDTENDEGVIINGIKWATRNLDSHGKFAANPEDFGALFQWGRKGEGHEQPTNPSYPTNDTSVENGIVSGLQNFDADGQIINTHAAYGKFIKQLTVPIDWRIPQNDSLWNYGNEAVPVKTANDPCPGGWRIPTRTELASLGTGEWTNTPVSGRYFGSETNTIFLPAAGNRYPTNGVLNEMGVCGYYWSSTPYYFTPNNDASSHSLFILSQGVHPNNHSGRASGLSVRCVSISLEGATLGGTVTITGNAVFDEILTANTSGLTSTPIIPDLGILSYQWIHNANEISGAISSSYNLTQNDISHIISVRVTTTNCYGSVISEPTVAVSKATQTEPEAPTLKNSTTTSIVLNPVPECEYNINGSIWQVLPTFEDLEPNSSYIFTQRKVETETHFASPASMSAQFSTEALGINENLIRSLNVHPNPNFGELRIENGGFRVDQVEIFDVIGKKVCTYTVSQKSIEIVLDISHLQKGYYLVKIFTEAGQVVTKVVKE